MANADIIELMGKDPEFESARKLENTKNKAKLVRERSLKTLNIMDIVKQHDITAEMTKVSNEIETEKGLVSAEKIEQHDIEIELVNIHKIWQFESETEKGSCETLVEVTEQIDIDTELSNMKNEIKYVGIATDTVVANMEIGGNDEQPDIDIGLSSVPEYTKYYEPSL